MSTGPHPDPVADPIQHLNIADLEAVFGRPEYGYFKCYISASGSGRNKCHYHGVWEECPRDEYLANYEQARQTDMDRFMAPSNVGSFWKYEKTIKREGWPQALQKALKERDELERKTP